MFIKHTKELFLFCCCLSLIYSSSNENLNFTNDDKNWNQEFITINKSSDYDPKLHHTFHNNDNNNMTTLSNVLDSSKANTSDYLLPLIIPSNHQLIVTSDSSSSSSFSSTSSSSSSSSWYRSNNFTHFSQSQYHKSSPHHTKNINNYTTHNNYDIDIQHGYLIVKNTIRAAIKPFMQWLQRNSIQLFKHTVVFIKASHVYICTVFTEIICEYMKQSERFDYFLQSLDNHTNNPMSQQYSPFTMSTPHFFSPEDILMTAANDMKRFTSSTGKTSKTSSTGPLLPDVSSKLSNLNLKQKANVGSKQQPPQSTTNSDNSNNNNNNNNSSNSNNNADTIINNTYCNENDTECRKTQTSQPTTTQSTDSYSTINNTNNNKNNNSNSNSASNSNSNNNTQSNLLIQIYNIFQLLIHYLIICIQWSYRYILLPFYYFITQQFNYFNFTYFNTYYDSVINVWSGPVIEAMKSYIMSCVGLLASLIGNEQFLYTNSNTNHHDSNNNNNNNSNNELHRQQEHIHAHTMSTLGPSLLLSLISMALFTSFLQICNTYNIDTDNNHYDNTAIASNTNTMNNNTTTTPITQLATKYHNNRFWFKAHKIHYKKTFLLFIKKLFYFILKVGFLILVILLLYSYLISVENQSRNRLIHRIQVKAVNDYILKSAEIYHKDYLKTKGSTHTINEQNKDKSKSNTGNTFVTNIFSRQPHPPTPTPSSSTTYSFSDMTNLTSFLLSPEFQLNTLLTQ